MCVKKPRYDGDVYVMCRALSHVIVCEEAPFDISHVRFIERTIRFSLVYQAHGYVVVVIMPPNQNNNGSGSSQLEREDNALIYFKPAHLL